MLNKRNRIANPDLLKKVLARGKRHRDDCFYYSFAQGEGPDSKFAVVVSKKTCKTAVGRNRLRRQVQEIVRLHLPATPWVVVITARQKAMEADFKTMEGLWAEFLKRLATHVE